jgi:hypothetical protein
MRPNHAKAQITNVRFPPAADITPLPRVAHRASWWETLRSPQEKMPQREACLAGGYIATGLADGNSVRFKRVK